MLIPHLVRAFFARSLRSLTLFVEATDEGFTPIGNYPVFAGLHSLHLSGSGIGPNEWAAIFNSSTLTAVEAITIGADQLPGYARSPMARRVRDLTVNCAEDLGRNLGPDQLAWQELIQHAPPPRRLVLNCHNPGGKVFVAMRRAGWLREVQELSISGDSQYEVYSGRTQGIRALFRSERLRKLTALRLHEACDRETLQALAEWAGTRRLESLTLTDDYHGRLVAGWFDPQRPAERLRRLEGVVLCNDEDVARFLAMARLTRVGRLQLSFCPDYDPDAQVSFQRLSPDAAERVVRSPGLVNVTEATFGFRHLPDVATRLGQVLADPAVMPRLRQLKLYGGYGDDLPRVEALRARFGPRLHAF
jgi:hypothetical protein